MASENRPAKSRPDDPTDPLAFPINSWLCISGARFDPEKLEEQHPADTLGPNTRPMNFYVQLDQATSSLLGMPLRVRSKNLPFFLAILPVYDDEALMAPARLISIDTRRLSLMPLQESYALAFYRELAAVAKVREGLFNRAEQGDPQASAFVVAVKEGWHTPAPGDFEQPRPPTSSPFYDEPPEGDNTDGDQAD